MLTAFAILTDGLVYAAYLFLVAVGLSLIFGVMKILNVTHGSFYAFGAYGAATAVGIYVERGWSDASGFLFMVLMAMAIGLVLGIIGGLFVVEALSVIIQVFFYKRTGKRVFKMAPIHHHFEQLGWSEPTVVIRFWIIALVLALAGLSTLKVR